MKIAVGSDHRGVAAKQRVLAVLEKLGHQIMDFGTDAANSVDYPDFAFKVAEAVGKTEADRGILICGTGLGMCMAANKVKGVRAAACHDSITAEMSRRHNDANILCFSAEQPPAGDAKGMVELWLATEFEGGRHQRRVDQIAQLERT